jgi:predicted TIM-barrel fold metal-dependent hydrolase
MIIDAHAHVYANPRIKLTSKSKKFISVKDQIHFMDRFGIEKAVILPIINPEVNAEPQGIDEILCICAEYPGRFIPFCNVDPRLTSSFYSVDPDHFEFVLNQFKKLGCKGLGELSAKVYWDDPALLALLEGCDRVGFPVTFHTSIADSSDYGLIDEVGFPMFEKVLRKFQKIIFFSHSMSFWSEISGRVSVDDKDNYPKGPVQPGGAVPRLMRRYSNLYGDLSAKSGLNALTRDANSAIDFIYEFQDQLVFGLDRCSVDDKGKLIQWLLTAQENGLITDEIYEKIMYKNISRVLELNL